MNVKDIYSLFQKTKGIVTDTRLSLALFPGHLVVDFDVARF